MNVDDWLAEQKKSADARLLVSENGKNVSSQWLVHDTGVEHFVHSRIYYKWAGRVPYEMPVLRPFRIYWSLCGRSIQLKDVDKISRCAKCEKYRIDH